MLGAYYSKAVDSKDIFDNLNVSNCESYEENLNKYNVLYLSQMLTIIVKIVMNILIELYNF